ncbi:MAG: MFS transporter [Dehalococcoidia bacterium]|jgi:predicted MFS family arabinose efflux permease|nr:MFS transporter [Dehalococcoidia bacterium]MDP7240100.1 MFS transporter [Dehalococcoidia bacterium]
MAGHFAHHLTTAIHQPLLPQIRDSFDLDYFRAGLIVSAFAIPYGFSQLPMGWLADRLGRRRLLSFGMMGIGLVALVIGLSTSYWQLLALLALLGLFGGAYHPSAAPLISAAVPSNRLGRALGVHLMGGSASFFLTPILAVTISLALGWRGPFAILAIPTFLTGVLFLKLLRSQPGAESAAPPKKTEKGALGDLVRRLGPLVGIGILAQSITMSITGFAFTLFLVDKHGMTPAYAGYFLALIYGAGLVGAPLGGILSDRLGRKPIILFSVLATGPIIYLFTVVPYGLGLLALAITMGLVMYMRQPVLESLVVRGVPAHRASSFLGIYYFGSIESSSVIAPLVGWIIDNHGIDRAFTLLGAVLFASALTVTLILSRSKTGSRATE